MIVLLLGSIAYVVLANQKSSYPIERKAPNFTLQDWDGKSVTLNDSAGKVRLVYFFYSSCPDVCSPTSYILMQVQDELVKKGAFGKKAVIHSVTIDPVRDTPEKLKEFAQTFHPSPAGWSFLRGEESATADIAKQFGIGIMKEKSGDFTHSNAIILVDRNGNIRNYYAGGDLSVDKDKIVKDVLVLSKEK